jgi:glycosyltransferase involved in cell wall biosynthesis
MIVTQPPEAPAKDIAVSVIIPVRNEELNIAVALDSVKWASEKWVVDSHSSDRTIEIVRKSDAQLIQFDYPGYGPKKKNWALENIPFRNEWVLILDADERVTAELQREIQRAIRQEEIAGYFLDRDYIFLGRSLRSFRPNWNLRLFRHRRGRYEYLATNAPATGDNEVHEHVIVSGRVSYLHAPLLHEDLRPIRAWIDNHNRYSDWEAQVYVQMRREPLQFTAFLRSEPVWRKRMLKRLWVRLPFRPILRFFLYYLARRGILDGRQGFQYAVLMAYYEFLISLKLREFRSASSASRSTHPI